MQLDSPSKWAEIDLLFAIYKLHFQSFTYYIQNLHSFVLLTPKRLCIMARTKKKPESNLKKKTGTNNTEP